MSQTTREPRKKRPLRKAPFVVIPSFLLLWLIGVATGEPARVLEQAMQVCLSCIGIG
ncbi:MAG: CD1871A family CXXC motif-containing protein [Deltaproteobacteria bacterium]|nr:CD1871A family CXXC motif-containing protein [Deltaproteobacteria bacterium]